MSDDLLITVGIICYREGGWLRECWESVLAQDDDRWEAVLVMDGGGDEATRTVFEEIEHPRLRKFAFEQNMGLYPVRNKAFEMTRTPYHFYLDGDDLLPPHAIRLTLEALDRRPSADIVIGDVEYFGERQAVLRRAHSFTADTVAAGGLGGGGGAAYQKAVWEKLGGYSTHVAGESADSEFHIAAFVAGCEYAHAGDILYRYRARAGSHSRKACFGRWKRCEAIAGKYPELFADERRRRLFLEPVYRQSFRDCCDAGRLGDAKIVARRALERYPTRQFLSPMWLLAKLPPSVFLLVRGLARLLRRARTHGG